MKKIKKKKNNSKEIIKRFKKKKKKKKNSKEIIKRFKRKNFFSSKFNIV